MSLVFDGGSGMRELGLARRTQVPHADEHVFFSHFHWDHIQGVPFFAPLLHADKKVSFYSPWPAESMRAALEGQMAEPYFPVPFESLAAGISFHQVRELALGGARVHAFELHHPGRAFGYAVEADGAKIVYATDHEHGDPAADARLFAATGGADVLLYDAHYTPEEYPRHTGWGHSTWREGVRLAQATGVKQLVLFHHHPAHTDEQMERILRAAQAEFPHTSLAAEGVVFTTG